jgi:hypothetical protein
MRRCTYHRHHARAGPNPAKYVSPRPTPHHSEAITTPLRRTPPGAQVCLNQGPDPHPSTASYVSTADSVDTVSRNERPTAVSTALPSAQLAPPAADPTTMPSCDRTGIRATQHHDRRRPTPHDLGYQIRSVEPETLTPSTQH